MLVCLMLLVTSLFPSEFKEAFGNRTVQSMIVNTEMLGSMPHDAQDKVRLLVLIII